MRALIPCLLFVALASGQAAKPADPSELFILEIDGEKHELVGGRETAITIGGKQSQVRITPRNYRLLRTPDFEFQFPRRYRFSYDNSDDQPTWAIDGTLSSITFIQLQVTSMKQAMDIFTNAMQMEGAKTSAIQLKLPKLTLDGVQIEDRGDPEFVNRSMLFPMKFGTRIWMLLITDASDAGQAMSPDLKRAHDMLRKTFRVR